MSALSSLFNRGLLGTRCKTCLNLAISRIKLLRNKREVQLKQMRREIAQYLQTGQEAIARIRVEHVVREENISAAYEILELFCEFVLARVPILETQRDCPTELQEAIASIVFAAPRCSDLPELTQVKNLFTAKYGKEFASAASELRPDTNVNRMIIEKLSVRAPPADVKLRLLKGIAREHNVEWDSSTTEAEFSKKHEDLLGGLNPENTRAPIVQSSPNVSLPGNGQPVVATNQNQGIPPHQAPAAVTDHSPIFSSRSTSMGTKKTELPVSNPSERPHGAGNPETNKLSSDVLERARAAIASAERASAAARAAAELASVRVHRQTGNGKVGE